MKKKYQQKVVSFTVYFLIIFVLPFQAFSDDLEIANGLSWLTAQQDPDNSTWGEDLVRETGLVVELLSALEETIPSDVLDFLRGQNPDTVDHLARKIKALAVAGDDVTTEVDVLLALQNSDGSLGFKQGYPGSVIDSFLAAQTLAKAGITGGDAIGKLIYYLTDHQDKDTGSYGYVDEDDGSLYLTCLAVTALDLFKSSYALSSYLEKAGTYISGFSIEENTILETAMAVQALTTGNINTSYVLAAEQYLKDVQETNGSWDNDTFTTAHVVRALDLVSKIKQPNLVITDENISVSPLYPVNGETVTVSCTIENNGALLAENSTGKVKAAFYKGKALETNRIQTVEINAIAAGETGLAEISFIVEEAGREQIIIIADPDNEIAEIDESDNTGAYRLTTGIQPDLYISDSDMVFDNPMPFVGESVNMKAVIHNLGETGSGLFTVFVYKGDPLTDGVLLGDTLLSGIAGQGQGTVTFDLILSEGTHDIYLKIDSDEDGNTSNNIADRQITFRSTGFSGMDLSVAESGIIHTPLFPNDDQTVTIYKEIQNTGDRDAVSVPVKVYIFGSGNERTIENTIDIYSGQKKTLTYTGKFDAGQHIIRVEIDPEETQNEITRINNTAQITFTVIETEKTVDLEALPVVIEPETPDYGEPLAISCGARNSGDVTLSNIRFRLYDGNPDQGASLLVSEITIPELAPGNSANIDIVKDTTLWGGSHQIWAVVDPDDAVNEINETNNRTSDAVSVPPPAGIDLQVVGSSLVTNPVVLVSGESAKIKCTIENVGTDNATAVPVSFFIDGQSYDNKTITVISAGDSETVEIDLDTSVFGGTHTVLVIVDKNGAIDETNEFNNIASIEMNISASDLEIKPSDITFSNNNTLPGETITIQAEIKNSGEQDTGPFKVVFYRGTPETGTVIGEDNMTGLAKDNSTSAEIDFTVPRSSNPVRITAVADAENETAETNEENNISYRFLNINQAWTDLSIDRYDVSVSPDYPSAYEPVMLLVRVRNKGTTAISGASISVYSEPNGNGDLLVPVIALNSLPAGSTQTVNAEFCLEPGAHEISIVAESATAETDTNNNLINRSISIRENILYYNDCGNPDNDTERTRGGDLVLSNLDPGNSIGDTTVSTDQTSVQYTYDGLDPDKDYEVVVSYLQENGGRRIQSLSADNLTIHGSMVLPEGKAKVYVFDLPEEAYVDGEIVLTFDNESQQVVVVSQIYIAEKYGRYQESVLRGVNWVANYQNNATGAWPSYDVTKDTARLLQALVALDRPEDEDWRDLLYNRLLELQGADGTWGLPDETGLAVIALLEAGMGPDSPEIISAKMKLEKYIDTSLENLNRDIKYSAIYLSTAMVAFIKAGGDPGSASIQNAARWLVDNQKETGQTPTYYGFWGADSIDGQYTGPFPVIALSLAKPFADSGTAVEINSAIDIAVNFWKAKIDENSPHFLYSRLEVLDAVAELNETLISNTVDELLADQVAAPDGAWASLMRSSTPLSEAGLTADIVRMFNEIKDKYSVLNSSDLEISINDTIEFLEERTTRSGDVTSLYDRTQETAFAAWLLNLYDYENENLKEKIKKTVRRLIACQCGGKGKWQWDLIHPDTPGKDCETNNTVYKNRPNALVSLALYDIPYQPSGWFQAFERSIQSLISGKNYYEGWPSQRSSGTPSDTVSSAFAVNSLVKGKEASIQYFDEAKFTEGLEWLLDQEDNGRFLNAYNTGFVVNALLNLDDITKYTYGTDAILSRSQEYLVQSQKENGSWGDIHSTALALVGLSSLGISGDAVNRGVNYLMAVQNKDGGWNAVAGSPQSETWATTVATWALHVADYYQDFEVDLQFNKPWYLPGDEVRMTVSVKNADINDLEITGTFSQYGGDTDNLTFAGNEASFILSDDREPGTDTVIITVKDADNRTGMTSGSIPVLGGYSGTPDLQITSGNIILSSPTPISGEQVTITALIENTTIYDAREVTVSCYTRHPDAGGVLIDISKTIGRVSGFDTQTIEFIWAALPGSHEIYIVIDPDGTVEEISDKNNTAFLPVSVSSGPSLPDLMVPESYINFSTRQPVEGETITIEAVVFNTGEADAQGVVVSFYTGAEQIGDNRTIPSIPAGDNATVQMVWPTMGFDGLNYIHVKADMGTEEITKLNNEAIKTIVVGEPDLPDFSIDSTDITFTPARPDEGDRVTMNALIENFGRAFGGVKVGFYNGDPDQDGELIGESVIYETVGFGESASVSTELDSAGLSGIQAIFVKIDPDNMIDEQNNDNNLASKSIDIASSGLEVVISTDTSQYAANEAVSVDVELSNLLDEGKTLELDVLLLDNNGNITANIVTGRDIILPSSGQKTENLSWNTGSIKAGEYSIAAVLYENQTKKTQASVDVVITADMTLMTEVFTDKTAYYSYDPVRLQSKIKSLSENYTFNDLEAEVIVKDTLGNTIITEQQDIEELFPLESRHVSTNWNTEDYPPGAYKAILNLRNGSVDLGNDNSSFTILSSYTDGKGLQGELSADPSSVHRGDEIRFEYEVVNMGNAYIDDLSLIVQIMDVTTEETVTAGEYTCSVDVGDFCNSTAVYQTGAMLPGPAVAVLLGIAGEVTQTLAFEPFNITNQCPVAHAGEDQLVYLGEPATVSADLSSDPDNDSIYYSWQMIAVPEESEAVLNDNDTETVSFTPDVHGDYRISLTVSDGICMSEPDIVIVTTDNRPPIADAGDNQTAGIGDAVYLDGSLSYDPDNDMIDAWFWTLIPPSGSDATLSDPNRVDPVFVPDMHGMYKVQLIVTGDGLVSEPDSIVITTQNQPPVAKAGDNRTAMIGEMVQLDGSLSSDPDNDSLGYQWSFMQKPDGSVCEIDNATSIKPSFVPDRTGYYIVRLTVTDNCGLEDEALATIQAMSGSHPDLSDLLGSAMLLEWEARELLVSGGCVEAAGEKISSSITVLNEIINRIYNDEYSDPWRKFELMVAAGYLQSAVYCDRLAQGALRIDRFWTRLRAVHYLKSALVFKYAALIIINGCSGVCDN